MFCAFYGFWGDRTCLPGRDCVPPCALVSHRRYLDVDSELRREASCLRGGSWVSNVSRGEMFEGVVGSTFLGWDQHGLRCLLFGRLFKALGVPIPVLRTTPSIAWESTVFGVAGFVAHFEARRWISGCMRTGLCCLASTREKPGDWPSHPGCLRCTFSSLGYFPAHIKGRSGLGFQRNLELAFSNLSAPAEP